MALVRSLVDNISAPILNCALDMSAVQISSESTNNILDIRTSFDSQRLPKMSGVSFKQLRIHHILATPMIKLTFVADNPSQRMLENRRSPHSFLGLCYLLLMLERQAIRYNNPFAPAHHGIGHS
jgi:hypothetical protein